MNYDQYEDVFVSRLEMPDVEVKVLPHVAALNAERPTGRPQLYVILHGATFGEEDNLNVVAQEETVNGEIFIRAKERRGDLGIFDLYEKICARLLGFRPPHAKESVTLGQFGYVTGAQNNWEYFLSFSFVKYRVQVDEEQDTQLITQITNEFRI